jgi:hypothetical protein
LIERLNGKQAAAYFWHPAGTVDGATFVDVPGVDYRACDGLCGAFQCYWPGVWMGHMGALPGVAGVDTAMRAILESYALETGAQRIIGWIKESNRPALALCRRVGFETDGRLPLAEPLIMVGWRPQCQ